MTAPALTTTSFESDALEALGHVRALFAQLIEKACPGDKSVSAVAEAFHIHRKLAWQVIKVAYSSEPFTAARHMPSAKGLEVWLKAAAKAGCPARTIQAAGKAGERFRAIAAAHTRTEEEFEILLGSQDTTDQAAHLKWRQQAFHGNSFVWGAHCKVLLTMMVLQPSDDTPRYFHAAQVRGLFGFRQTRPGVRWLINQSVVADDHAQANTTLRRVPLDAESARLHSGVPILPQFCSTPIPLFARRNMPNGALHDEFAPGPVGRAGERTLVTAEVIRNLGPAHATAQDRTAHFGAGVRIPTEMLHLDVFVHRALFGAVQRELCMFSDLTSDVAFDAADSLPLPERIEPLGRGLTLAQSPDVPAYADLASTVFSRLGAQPQDYDLFRVRVPFPPMPVSVMLRHPLPEPHATQKD